MSLEQIMHQVEDYPSELVEITGGEPLLQKAVHNLVLRLLDRGKTVLIETGGHRDVSRIDKRAILIYDIKCPGSGMSDKNRWENLPTLSPKDQIKFVLSSRDDYDWAKQVMEKYGLGHRHEVLLSPVWGALPAQELAEWVLGDGLPVRVQLQLHKILWGNKRGV